MPPKSASKAKVIRVHDPNLGKIREDFTPFKYRVRKLIPVSAESDVFEMFAGLGRLYHSIWHVANRGVTTDIKKEAAELAARDRPCWTVLCCDIDKALRAGLYLKRPFDIVDMDCYGAPWKFMHAYFLHKRVLASPTYMVLTDHYMMQRNLSGEEKILALRKPSTAKQYLAAVDVLLNRLICVAQGRKYTREIYTDKQTVQHLIVIE